jgi:hypothetical protein
MIHDAYDLENYSCIVMLYMYFYLHILYLIYGQLAALLPKRHLRVGYIYVVHIECYIMRNGDRFVYS